MYFGKRACWRGKHGYQAAALPLLSPPCNTLEYKLEKIIGIQKNEEKIRKNTFIRSCGDILYNLRSLVSRSMQQRNSILASVLSEYLLLLTRYFAHLSMASNLKIFRKKTPQNARLWFNVLKSMLFLIKTDFHQLPENAKTYVFNIPKKKFSKYVTRS